MTETNNCLVVEKIRKEENLEIPYQNHHFILSTTKKQSHNPRREREYTGAKLITLHYTIVAPAAAAAAKCAEEFEYLVC